MITTTFPRWWTLTVVTENKNKNSKMKDFNVMTSCQFFNLVEQELINRQFNRALH